MGKMRAFNPGGTPGKLHRALGVPTGDKIPQARLASAEHSPDRGVRDMAIRAKTMEAWRHGPSAHPAGRMAHRP
jgi:hypothetical protein